MINSFASGTNAKSGEPMNIVVCDQSPKNQFHLQKEIVYVQPGYGKCCNYSVLRIEIFQMYQFVYF